MPNYEDQIDGGWDAHVEEKLDAASGSHADGVHRYQYSGPAYDDSQCNDAVRDGDVLVAEAEGVVGILYRAYPVAITKRSGQFHGFQDDFSPEDKYTEQIAKAVVIAQELGFEIEGRWVK